MKILDRQKLDVINKSRSNPESFRGCRGQFTPEVKPLEFERFSNCGEFAIMGSPALEMTPVLIPSNSTGLQHPPEDFGDFECVAVAERELVLCED